MKYILLIPAVGYYLIRDTTTLLAHSDLARGLTTFILTFLFLLFFFAWLNIARELSKVKRQVGSSAYEWMVNK